MDTLTGFKYIAEKIEEFYQTKQHTSLFGYEVSYGYLIGDFVRDKDAMQTALVTAEMTGYYQKQRLSLSELWKSYIRSLATIKKSYSRLRWKAKLSKNRFLKC